MGRRQGEGLDRRSPSAFPPQQGPSTGGRSLLQDGHSAAPKLAGVQACQTGVASRDQDRSHLQKCGVCSCWWYLLTTWAPRSAYSSVQYLATGTSGGLQLPSSRAPGTTTQTHRHRHTHTLAPTHTHTPRDRSGLFEAYLSTTRRPLRQRPVKHTQTESPDAFVGLFSPYQVCQSRRPECVDLNVWAERACLCPLLGCPSSCRWLPLQYKWSSRTGRTGHQGQERNSQAGHGATTHANWQFNCEPHPGPLSNHPTKHTRSKQGRGRGQTDGAGAALRDSIAILST